jgi:cell division protein FtsL
MSLRVTMLIYMAVIAIAGFGVYLVKYTVQDMQRQVAALDKELQQERELLHLLKAEWAYLNRPERLERLASRHLKMVPLEATTLSSVRAIPTYYYPKQQQKNTSPSASESIMLYQPVGGY